MKIIKKTIYLPQQAYLKKSRCFFKNIEFLPYWQNLLFWGIGIRRFWGPSPDLKKGVRVGPPFLGSGLGGPKRSFLAFWPFWPKSTWPTLRPLPT